MELLEFMRQRKRMCDYYGDDTCMCDDSRGVCPALAIDCSFSTDNPEHLIAIVEKWAKEHPKEAKQNDTENHRTESIQLSIEGRLGMLEHDMRIMSSFMNGTVDKIREIKEHAAHQDRAIMCDCVHVDDTEKEQSKKSTRMETFLELFPNARMSNSVHVPLVKPCETDERYMNRDCTHVKCYECMEKYWNEEVDG